MPPTPIRVEASFEPLGTHVDRFETACECGSHHVVIAAAVIEIGPCAPQVVSRRMCTDCFAPR